MFIIKHILLHGELYYTAHFDPNRHRKYTQNKRIDTGDIKGTIVFGKRYYRFWKKVLSFSEKSTIVFDERYYRF